MEQITRERRHTRRETPSRQVVERGVRSRPLREMVNWLVRTQGLQDAGVAPHRGILLVHGARVHQQQHRALAHQLAVRAQLPVLIEQLRVTGDYASASWSKCRAHPQMRLSGAAARCFLQPYSVLQSCFCQRHISA